MADNWVSPTGHNDPDSKWASEANAYDNNTGTSAYNGKLQYGYYLELTLSAIVCDKVRIYATDWHPSLEFFANPDLDIDVYYDSAWHNIFSGSITKQTWIEKAIGSTKTVTKARVKSNSAVYDLLLYEFDFNSIPPTVETDACSGIGSTSLDANGDIIASGGATTRGFHYSKVFDGFEWGIDTDPLSDDGGAIDWTVSAAGTSKAEIDTAQHYSGTRSARLYRDGTNRTTAHFLHTPLTPTQPLAFQIRKDDTSYFVLGHGNGTWLISMMINTAEQITYYDTGHHLIGTISVGAWYLLSIRNVNWTAHTYDVYLNGSLIKSGAGMRNQPWNNGQVAFINDSGTSEVWIDNVAVWDVEDEDGSFGAGEYSLEITGLDSPATYYVQAFAENSAGFGYGAIETCRTIIAKVLSDTVAISDALVKSVSMAETDTLAITDGIVKTVGLKKSDSVAISDTIVKSIGLFKADTLALADAIIKAVSLGKADTVTIADAIVKIISLAKADTVIIADSISKALSLVKADAVTITDSIRKAVSIVKADAMAIADTITHIGLGKFIRLADTVTITDSLMGVLRHKSYLKQAINRMGVKGLDAAKISIDKMGIDQMAIKGMDIAQMRAKGMGIARMQIKRMGAAKTALFRWITRRWTA